MFSAIKQFVSRASLDEDTWVRVDRTTFGEGAELSLHVILSHEDGSVEPWLLRSVGPYDFRLMEGVHDPVQLAEPGHPLLADATEPHERLHFQAAPRSSLAVMGALYAAHVAWAGPWLPFGTYFNDELPLAELLAGGHGELARGPRSFINALRKALVRLEVPCSTLVERAGPSPLAGQTAAILFGASNYVRAAGMIAEPVAVNGKH